MQQPWCNDRVNWTREYVGLLPSLALNFDLASENRAMRLFARSWEIDRSKSVWFNLTHSQNFPRHWDIMFRKYFGLLFVYIRYIQQKVYEVEESTIIERNEKRDICNEESSGFAAEPWTVRRVRFWRRSFVLATSNTPTENERIWPRLITSSVSRSPTFVFHNFSFISRHHYEFYDCLATPFSTCAGRFSYFLRQ